MLAVMATCLPVIAILLAVGVVKPERTVTRQDTIDHRVELMHASVKQFEKYPVLGMGLGRFRDYYGIIVHNTPLWFLVDFGLVGMACSSAFWVGRSFPDLARTSQRHPARVLTFMLCLRPTSA